MTLKKYKAKNGLDFLVPGVGQSVNGILETDVDLSEAPSLELVTDTPGVQAETPVAAPGAVIGTAPQATTPSAPAEETKTEAKG
jgi:hypothetical protein